MRPVRDPEKNEVRHLMAAAQFPGKKVLEIGCGNADFLRQYASIARAVVGIDPCFHDLETARSNQAASGSNFSIAHARGEELPFPAGTFDIAVLASSL